MKIIMRSVCDRIVCGTIFGKWNTGSHNDGTMGTWKALKQVYQNHFRTDLIFFIIDLRHIQHAFLKHMNRINFVYNKKENME